MKPKDKGGVMRGSRLIQTALAIFETVIAKLEKAINVSMDELGVRGDIRDQAIQEIVELNQGISKAERVINKLKEITE